MRLRNITISKNTLLLAYKLLHDALFLALVSLAGVLFADGLLPGILTSKIGFSKIIFVIIIILTTIVYLGKNLDITYPPAKIHKGRLLPALVFLSFLLIGNSLLKFGFWENIIITITTLFVFFLFYELIFVAEAE